VDKHADLVLATNRRGDTTKGYPRGNDPEVLVHQADVSPADTTDD
jgi:hypothetical protein